METHIQHIRRGIEILANKGFLCQLLGARIQHRAIKYCVSQAWDTIGEVTINYHTNGYFLSLFSMKEDRDHIFQGGPWFYNKSSLFMKPWHFNFKLREGNPIEAPVWVRLSSLSSTILNKEAFDFISNIIGVYLCMYDQIQEHKLLTYDHIYVHVDLEAPVLAKMLISLPNDGMEWGQTMDYEKIPFRCQVYLDNGYLAKKFPHVVINTLEPKIYINGFQ